MTKISYEDKLNIYQLKKQGVSYSTIKSKYSYGIHNIQYLERLIDKHGYDILRTTKNKTYTKEFKQEAIDRVLINNETVMSVSINIGLPSDGLLQNWIKKYKEMGYNIVERKRGRPTMNKKELKPKKNETLEEENERLKKENLYLKAELEYSKKLRAVVQARKNQQQKKK